MEGGERVWVYLSPNRDKHLLVQHWAAQYSSFDRGGSTYVVEQYRFCFDLTFVS